MSILPIRNLGNFAGGGTKDLFLINSGELNQDYLTINSYGGGNAFISKTDALTNGVGLQTQANSHSTDMYHIVTIRDWIDVTNFDTLEFNVTSCSYRSLGFIRIGISSDNTSTTSLNTYVQITTIGTYRVNIANIIGRKYFKLYIVSDGGCTVNINTIKFFNSIKKYLYKDGKQNVAWDNSGTYPIANGYTSDGASTFDDSTITMPIPSTGLYSRILVTQNKIDVTDYDYLNLAISYPNEFKHVKLDVKSIIGSYYVNFGPYKLSNGNVLFGTVLSNVKNNSYNDRVALLDTQIATSGNVTVTRVWLEK